MPPVVSVVGASGSGKTTLLEKLIAELKRRGFKVGTVKHAGHHFDFDIEGKDTDRHMKAGADTVMIASTNQIAMIKNCPCNSLNDIEMYFQDMDIVITEGYKKESRPKIEIHRKATNKAPIFKDRPENNLIAFVTDADFETQVEKFGLDDILALADFIEKRYL